MQISLCMQVLTQYSKFGTVIAHAASEPEASEQVSSSNSYWALKSESKILLPFLRPECILLADQNALHA